MWIDKPKRRQYFRAYEFERNREAGNGPFCCSAVNDSAVEAKDSLGHLRVFPLTSWRFARAAKPIRA